MKIDTGIILNVVISVLAVLLIFIPIRYDLLKNTKKYRKSKNKTLIESLTKWGWTFFILCSLMILFNVWKICYDSLKTSEYELQINNLTNSNKNLENKAVLLLNDNKYLKNKVDGIYSSTDTTNRLLRSQPKLRYEANLEISPPNLHNTNPVLIFNGDRTGGEFILQVSNSGNLKATKIKAKLVYFKYSPLSENKFDNLLVHIFDEPNSDISPTTLVNPPLQFNLNVKNIHDKKLLIPYNSFFAFKITYFSEKDEKSLIGVYKIENERLKYVKKELYYEISKHLGAKKIW